MSQNLVFVKVKDGVANITLNDPDSLNAMSEAMAEEFLQCVETLRVDESLRVVVLRGEGKAFSAGGHLDMLLEKTKISFEKNKRLMEVFYKQFLSVRSLPVPVIAAINGHAVGAGLCVCLACDVRVAVKEAKLGLNFVKLGLHPGMGATYFLPRLIGHARASELLYCGSIITAAEAYSFGLLNHVESSNEAFEERVSGLIEMISSSGPQSIRALKASLLLNENLSLNQALAREAECQARDYSGAEFLEGVNAVKEKRKPDFS